MPSREDLKRSACDAIDRRKGELIAIAREIFPEPRDRV